MENQIKILSAVVTALSLTGCSMFSKSSNKSDSAPPEIRDVPFEARDAEAGLRHRLFILPFLDEQPQRGVRVAEEARRTVVRELSRTGQFVMVSPEDFNQDPKKFMTAENEYDLGELAKATSGMGVAAVLEGKILEVKARRIGDQVGIVRQLKAQVEAKIRVRMYSSKTGRELLNDVRSAVVDSVTTRVAESSFSDRYLSEDPELISQAVKKAFGGIIPGIARAVEKLNWEGRVAMISGERVFVNAGRLSGLQIGDILKITEEGEEVFDPETGRFIGKAPGRMKGTVEVISYFGKDGSIAVIHSGSGFKENDRVELY